MQGDLYGGPLKGDPPADNAAKYNAQEIRQWALDTDPGKVSSAGQAFLEFAKAFRGSDHDDLLGFIQQFGNDLDQAWNGADGGAPEAQTQLSWLWSSAKEMVGSAEALGQSLKNHGDNNLKPFKEYFHVKDSGWKELWGLVTDPSPFFEDVAKQSGGAGFVNPDDGFKYQGGLTNDTPQPGSLLDQASWQVANQVAQQKLAQHIGQIQNTYSGMPGYLSMTLPTGIVPPQQDPPSNPLTDPNNPANPKDPGGPQHSSNTTGPGGPGGPNPTGPHIPAFSPSAQIPHSGNGAVPSPNLPTNATLPPGSTDLSHAPVSGVPPANVPGAPHLGPSPTIPGGTTPIPGGSPGVLPVTAPSNWGGNAKLPANETFPGLGKAKLPGEGKIPGLGESPFGPGAGSASRGLIGGGGLPRGTSAEAPTGAASPMTSEANAANAARAEQAAMEGAAARGAGGVMPMYPPMGGGMGGQNGQERPVTMPLTEDEAVWESGGDAVPPLIC